MKYGKKTEIKLNPLSYNFMLIGEGGIGKTTIINEYCKTLTDNVEDAYLFVETGREDGNEAINGLPAIIGIDWNSDYDENFGDVGSIGVRTLVDDIVENKTTDWANLKVVVFDTLDELFKIAEREVIRMHNKENPNKKVKSIKAAFGGYQAGEDKAVEIVEELLWDLKKVGVNFIVIGHTKSKAQTDIETGAEYQQLTTNMPQKYFDAIKNKTQFLGVASIDRDIVREKTGKKDFHTKKDIEKGVIKNETRKITFRDNNYNIDSKSRFADIIPSIPLDVNELIKALTDAIKAEYVKSGKSIETGKEEQDRVKQEQMQRIAEAEQQRKNNAEINKVKTQIIDFFTSNKTNIEIIKPILTKIKEYGYNNPNDINKLEHANSILSECLKY